MKRVKRILGGILAITMLLNMNMNGIVLASELPKEENKRGVFSDSKQSTEEHSFEEYGDTVKMVFTRVDGIITEIDVYKNGVFYENVCITPTVENLNIFQMPLTRAYENRKFTANKLVLTDKGNKAVDNLRKSTIISCVAALPGMAKAPYGTLAAIASSILNYFLNKGYTEKSNAKVSYSYKKYWANTKDGIDPVIYRTTYKYTFVGGKMDTQILYTYNNPI